METQGLEETALPGQRRFRVREYYRLAEVTRHEQQTAEVHPRTALLVVEASGESLRGDRGIKRKLYARANVTEYWIAIVEEKKFEVYTDPDPASGHYRTMKVVGLGETLTPMAIAGVSIPVSALFETT